MANRKGTAFLVRVSDAEAEKIRRAAALVIKAGGVKNLNDWMKRAALEHADADLVLVRF